VSAAWFTPQSGDRDLAPHAHRLELRGVPTGFVWPDVCPACGAVARVFARLIPTRIGVFALGDAGRVWADGTRSSRVHAAAGGGLSLSFFDNRQMVSLAVASGEDGSRWHVRTGIGF
jgi:hypothetical protein